MEKSAEMSTSYILIVINCLLFLWLTPQVSSINTDLIHEHHQPPTWSEILAKFSEILEENSVEESPDFEAKNQDWILSRENRIRGINLLNINGFDQLNVEKESNNSAVPIIKKTIVSKPCLDDINFMLGEAALGKSWALKVADSFSKPPPGILEGNTVWLGSFDECRRINVKVNRTQDLPSSEDVWIGKYCTCGVSPASKEKQPSLTVGVCLSSLCTVNDTEALINRGLLVLPGEMVATGARCQPSSPALSKGAIWAIVLLSILGVLLLAGTSYDLVITYACALRNNSSSESVQDNDSDIHEDKSDKKLLLKKPPPKGLLGEILLCFSIPANTEKIFDVRPSPDHIYCLNGMIVISMAWIILGHSFFFAIMFIENTAVMPDILRKWSILLVENSSLAVITFFLMSGLMSSYLLLKQITFLGSPTLVNWPLYYVKRYLRLTPSYMFILGLNATLFVYMGDGPEWPWGTWERYCPSHWWTNLLYVNNLIYQDEQCMASTWYLAADMQCFVFLPLIVVILYKCWFVGLTLVVGIFVTFLTVIATFGGMFSANSTGFLQFWRAAGAQSSCAAPYLIGIMFGYIFVKIGKSNPLHRGVVILGWMTALLVCLATFLNPYSVIQGSTFSVMDATHSWYTFIHRTAWALAVAWIIIACGTGNGGIINSLLSWPGFIPLSRLSFIAFLVHPSVIYHYLYRLRQTIYYDDYSFMYIHLGNLVVSYGIALLASLALEGPVVGLLRLVFRRKAK